MLWVFRSGAKEMAEFEKTGELAKMVTRIGAGPGGMTLRAPDAETLDEYTAWKPGFTVRPREGRIWVFLEGAKELAEFEKAGELAKMVTRIGAGPGGATLRAPDAETLDLYTAAKEGFAVRLAEGRMYVFRMDAKELPEFDRAWDLAKMVTRTGAGPGGMTLRAPDAETLDAYALSKPGFVVRISDGRGWVFRKGAKELAEYEKSGELAKMVTRTGAGPGGMTLRAPDAETLDAWAASR